MKNSIFLLLLALSGCATVFTSPVSKSVRNPAQESVPCVKSVGGNNVCLAFNSTFSIKNDSGNYVQGTVSSISPNGDLTYWVSNSGQFTDNIHSLTFVVPQDNMTVAIPSFVGDLKTTVSWNSQLIRKTDTNYETLYTSTIYDDGMVQFRHQNGQSFWASVNDKKKMIVLVPEELRPYKWNSQLQVRDAPNQYNTYTVAWTWSDGTVELSPFQGNSQVRRSVDVLKTQVVTGLDSLAGVNWNQTIAIKSTKDKFLPRIDYFVESIYSDGTFKLGCLLYDQKVYLNQSELQANKIGIVPQLGSFHSGHFYQVQDAKGSQFIIDVARIYEDGVMRFGILGNNQNWVTSRDFRRYAKVDDFKVIRQVCAPENEEHPSYCENWWPNNKNNALSQLPANNPPHGVGTGIAFTFERNACKISLMGAT